MLNQSCRRKSLADTILTGRVKKNDKENSSPNPTKFNVNSPPPNNNSSPWSIAKRFYNNTTASTLFSSPTTAV